MLKSLVIIRMKSMFAGMFARGKSRQRKGGVGTKLLIVIIAIYLVVCFGGLFGMIFHSICEPFVSIGMGWLYFGFMALMVFLLCFVGSIFVTQNQLYDATDNELLLSMPIPPKYILASRLLALVLLNYVYEFLIVVPAGVVYCILQPVTILGVVLFILSALILPLLVIVFSALFGWIIAMANTKMRNKNVITMILSVVLFVAYMYLCLTMQDYLQKLINNGTEVGQAIKTVLPPFYYLGKGIYSGDLLAFGGFLLWTIIPFIIVYKILDMSFIKIATTNRGMKKIKYKEKELKVQSVKRALLMKEIRHFFGNPMYIFNAAIGLVFLIICSVYLAVQKDTIYKVIENIGGTELIGPVICLGFGLMLSMTIISSPSISTESKTLWICNSAPINVKDILLAKVKLHIYVSLPFVIIGEIIILSFYRLSILTMVTIILFPIIDLIFDALLGLALNLKYPKFDWINETAAIKQGASPTLSMLISASVILAPAIIYLIVLQRFNISAEMTVLILLGIIAIGSVLLYRHIVTKGIDIYNNLQS